MYKRQVLTVEVVLIVDTAGIGRLGDSSYQGRSCSGKPQQEVSRGRSIRNDTSHQQKMEDSHKRKRTERKDVSDAVVERPERSSPSQMKQSSKMKQG